MYQTSSSGVPGGAAEQAVIPADAVAARVAGSTLAVGIQDVPTVNEVAPAHESLAGGAKNLLTHNANSPLLAELATPASYIRI